MVGSLLEGLVTSHDPRARGKVGRMSARNTAAHRAGLACAIEPTATAAKAISRRTCICIITPWLCGSRLRTVPATNLGNHGGDPGSTPPRRDPRASAREGDERGVGTDGVGVAELVRREASPESRLAGEPPELDARVGARPGPPAGRAVDNADSGPPGSSRRASSQRRSFSQPQASMPISRRDRPCRCARAATAPSVEVSLPERQRSATRRPPRQSTTIRRAACSRGGRRWPRASRRRSLPPSAGQRDRPRPLLRGGRPAW